nr:integrin beta-PS-like [Onthophagus taurus]
MKCTTCVLGICLIIISVVDGQNVLNCEDQENCGKCIQQPGCVWCSAPNIPGTPQCRLEIEIKSLKINSNWCPENEIISPQIEYNITQNIDLNDGKTGSAVQIKPQRVKLRLRRGEEYKLSFQYSKAANYPIDLYYLMDLSKSMADHKDKLAQLGNELVSVMKNITTDFRLGFGSFVDKIALPFTSTHPSKINEPCTGCVPAYSYKNHLSLTRDHQKFSTQVGNAKVSGNLDFPEGGFDALMQAIVCKNEIGWREDARHMLIFSTDADSHVAGDGRLAGAIEPNDAMCHLENNSYTTKALQYDYPSVSHLNYVAKQNNINIMFAIAGTNQGSSDRVVKWYNDLKPNIENSVVGVLERDSSNVVQLVLENYNKIVDSIRITDNSSSTIDIKYESPCFTLDDNICNNITVGKSVNFTAVIKPIECSSGKQLIQIKPEGVSESLIVELEIECSCSCEKQGEYVTSSPDCSYNGTKICGVCECDKGFFGKNCECNQETASSTDDSSCKRKPTDSEVCSGLGTCKCGKCICQDRPGQEFIYGKYCECNNYSCKRIKGLLCSGEDRGKCECGQCSCLPGWTGDACDCSNRNDTCISQTGNGLICSGHGNCVCGECQCNQDGYKYSGNHCEECASCPGQRCEELHPCVECQVFKTGKYNESHCEMVCIDFNTTTVTKIEEDTENHDIKTCRVFDDEGCAILFQYQYGANKELIVVAQDHKECPEPVDILVVILSVIASIVLGGLILLIIWKVLTSIHDKIEYEKFEKERKEAKFDVGQNPLYKGASTTFQNPTYRK